MNDNIIGHYRIVKKMGAGGMARVYLAVHREIPNLRVVLKVLTDPQLADRFKQEADKLALLDGHPNICRIRHFFDHGDDLVIAMDFIDGPTVEAKIKKSGPLQYEDAISIISQVLDVLEIAHSRGISHRDIKPSNIMIDTHGRVQVIDFGIARGEADPSMTAAHGYAGTPDYMAPEQFGASKDTNYALADIYAVGVTLYEMLCGALPFPGGDVFTIRDAKLFKEPTNPRQYRPDMSKHLEQVISKAINRDPADRFQSAREMKEFLLAGSARDDSRKTPPPTPAGSAKPPKIKKPRTGKSPVPKILTYVVMLAALAAAGYYGWPFIQKQLAASNQEPTTPTQPPAPPPQSTAQAARLVAPLDGSAISVEQPLQLVWTSSGENTSYAVQLARDPEFSTGQLTYMAADTFFVPSTTLDSGQYFWRIRTNPTSTPPGPFSNTGSFVVTIPAPATAEPPATVAPGTVAVSVDRPSTISVDGRVRERSATQLDLSLAPGSHTIKVENSTSRERSQTQQVEVASDETVTKSFTFTDLASGTIRVTSIPEGAEIVIDGERQRGVTTPQVLTLTEGKHVVSVVSAEKGNRTMQETVTIKPEGNDDLEFDFTTAETEMLARKLADSIRVVKASMSDAVKGSGDFKNAEKTEFDGNKKYADGTYQGAVQAYRDALAMYGQVGNASSESALITAAIEEFRSAYETTDIKALKIIYPKIPGSEEKGWKQFFGSVRDLTVTMTTESMDVTASKANATINVRMQFADDTGKKDQTFRWLLQFEKTGGNWVVAKRESL